MNINTQKLDELTHDISIQFSLTKNDFIYYDFISLSIDHPHVHCSAWETRDASIPYYDPLFKETKRIFKNNVTISTKVKADHQIDDPVYLYCTYYQRSEKKINQCCVPLSFANNTQQPAPAASLHTALEISGQHSFHCTLNINITPLFQGIIILFLIFLYATTCYLLHKKNVHQITHKIL